MRQKGDVVDQRCFSASFAALPDCFHLVEIRVFEAAPFTGECVLDSLEATHELCVGRLKRRFRIDIVVAGEVGGGEQQVTDFLSDIGLVPRGHGLADFLEFFADLGEHLFRGQTSRTPLSRRDG